MKLMCIHLQVNEMPQMEAIATMLQQLLDHTDDGAEKSVRSKSSDESINGSGENGTGNDYNANSWLFGSSDD